MDNKSRHKVFEDSNEYVTVTVSIDQKAFDRLDKEQLDEMIKSIRFKGLNKVASYLTSDILRTIGKNTLRS